MVRPLPRLRAFCSTTTLALFCTAALLASPVGAQELPPATDEQAPAHIAFVDGVAVLERDGEIDNAPVSMPLLAGDRVRTRGGRVEILFADGSTLHLDHNTVVDLQSDELVRLIAGRIRLSIPGRSRAVGYRVDGPHGWAQIDEPGEYRVALLNAPGGSELELAVIRGRAALANDGGQTPLRAGERAFVRAAAAPSYAFVLNSAAWDAFDRWSEARRDERMGESATYLPDEVRPYAASLDRHGYWRDEPTYGRVWYPRVQSDWRPYYRGRWANLRPYGWTWVGHDPWGWPTHHYGRWGIGAGGWFWIPGRTWGAAWVSWASAPGYVSWCPLGWDNRPVFQINIINVRRGYDPWRGWTVLPQGQFGRGYVHRNVVRAGYIDTPTRAAFRQADRAPQSLGYAVPRASRPIRTAGTMAGRAAAPLYTNLPEDRGRMRTDGNRVRVPNGRVTGRADADPSSPSRAVPRDRTTPERPLVRSERPAQSESRHRAVERSVPAPERYGSAPRSPESRVTAPRQGSPDETRGQRTRPESPRYRPSPSEGGFAVPRARSPREHEPARTDLPAARSAPEGVRPDPRPSPRFGGESRPSGDAPGRRAVPGEDPRPSAGEPRRGPQPERRAPDRPPSGSTERRAPASAQPSAPPRSGDRPAAAPAGARPRSPGSSSGGMAVRRPGGR